MDRRNFLFAAALAGASPASAQTPQFRKSICNPMIHGPEDLPGRFRSARNAGFEGVEVRLGNPPGEIPGRGSLDDWRRIGDAARAAGIEIVSVWATLLRAGGPASLFSPEPEVRERAANWVRRAVDAAAALDCNAVLMNMGSISENGRQLYRYGDAWKRSSDFWRELIPYAAEKRVVLTPENVWSDFLLSPLEFRQYVRQFNSPWLQAHFDVGNVMPRGFADDWILTLGPLVHRVHLKDFRRGRRPNEGDFVPLLSGDIDYPAVMKALVTVGYRGFLSPEGPQEPDAAALLDLSNRVDKIIAMAG